MQRAFLQPAQKTLSISIESVPTMAIMNILILLFCILCGAWFAKRIHSFLTFSKKDRRIFSLFWLWPALFFVHQYLIKIWLCPSRIYQIAFYFICAGIIIDGFYYFLLKTRTKPRLKHQILSALGWIPVLGIYGSLHLQPKNAMPLLLPHYDKAWTWREPLWGSHEFYFMKPEKTATHHPDPLQDPNYGQAIFAPCSGRILGFDKGSRMLHLSPEGFENTDIFLGPFLEDTLRATTGQAIIAGQPLGLQSESGAIPGIKLVIHGEKRAVFTQYLSGQYWARVTQRGVPSRNQTVANNADKRFRLDGEP